MNPTSLSGPSTRALSLADLLAAASTEVDWLWEGYLARGGVTLLTSRAPDGTTLTRWLLAVEGGVVSREGTGRRNDPFRYWLPQRVEVWRRDPLFEIREELEAQARRLNEGDTGRPG